MGRSPHWDWVYWAELIDREVALGLGLRVWRSWYVYGLKCHVAGGYTDMCVCFRGEGGAGSFCRALSISLLFDINIQLTIETNSDCKRPEFAVCCSVLHCGVLCCGVLR